jgi:hypothetical protein
VRRLAALGVLAALLLAAPPVLADPSPTPQPSPTVQGPESPLRIDVTKLLPRAPVRHDAVVIAGTVTNTDPSKTVTKARVVLALGEVINLRGALHDADTDRPPTTPRLSIVASVQPLDPAAPRGQLAPGASGEFVLRTNVDDLGLRRSGVYPLDVVARGTLPGEDQQNLGSVPTWLPYFSPSDGLPRANRIAVAVPLVDAPRQAPDNTFLDDDLATNLSDAGALGRLLHGAEIGATTEPSCGARDYGTAPGSTALKPILPLTRCEQVPVTYAVDPDLLSAVDLMATSDKYLVRTGDSGRTTTDGKGKTAARIWLDALKADVAKSTGSALYLPYADVDASALAGSDLGGKGARDVSSAMLLGDQVGQSVLKKPSVSVAWPSDEGVAGVLTQKAAEVLTSTGDRTFLLDESAYPQTDEGISTPRTRTRLTYTSTTGSPLFGLVSDPDLSALVTGTRQDCTCSAQEVGSRLAEQRFIAETALLAAELPGTSRTFVIAPSRGSDAAPAAMAASLADLGRLPWLCPVSLQSVADQVEACSGALPVPSKDDSSRGELRTSLEGLLPLEDLRAIGGSRDHINQLTDYVMDGSRGDADRAAISTLKTRINQAVLRAESSAWREHLSQGQEMVRLLAGAVDAEVKKVSLAGGKLLLTSSKGTLQVSIQNSLDLPIKVRVQFTYLNTTQVTPMLTVGAKSAISASVKADAQRSGKFLVTARMLDRNLGPGGLGKGFRQPAFINVRSTQYGRLALGVTFAAAAVLFVAAGVRIVRRSLASGSPGTPQGPDPE